MRFAYADPPYIGQAQRHYGDDERAAEVNHRLLVAYLQEFDGWALSCSASSLREVLLLCPESTRVLAWVKPWCSWKPGIWPAYAWEPVLIGGGRKVERDRERLTPRDWLAAPITSGRSVHGAKPDQFCCWLFEVLGMEPDDDFVDVFPGSGAVTRAWKRWRSREPVLQLQLTNWLMPTS